MINMIFKLFFKIFLLKIFVGFVIYYGKIWLYSVFVNFEGYKYEKRLFIMK